MNKKKKILIIEDDPPTIDVYTTMFKEASFGFRVASTGKEAMALVEKINNKKRIAPDLVILDIILPDMNGIKILEQMKKGSETKNIPVFVLTNFSDKDFEKMSKLLKSEKYLLKTDYIPSKIIEIIKERLGS